MTKKEKNLSKAIRNSARRRSNERAFRKDRAHSHTHKYIHTTSTSSCTFLELYRVLHTLPAHFTRIIHHYLKCTQYRFTSCRKDASGRLHVTRHDASDEERNAGNICRPDECTESAAGHIMEAW